MTRPKKPAPDGVSLRQAAEDLGMSRRVLMRHVAAGLPVTRQSERVFVNVRDAHLWLALNDLGADAPRSHAPTLDPADPRYAERNAAARIQWLKAGLRAGAFVAKVDALARYSAELTDFRQAFLSLPQRFTVTAPRDVTMRDLEDGIEESLTPLRADDVESWPLQRGSLRALARDVGGKDEADADGARVPLFRSNDPRHAFARSAASKREIELAELSANVLPLAWILDRAERTFSAVRERVREVPLRVELADEDGGLLATIGRELDAALVDLSTRESSHAQP